MKSSQLCFTCVFQCSLQLCFTAMHWSVDLNCELERVRGELSTPIGSVGPNYTIAPLHCERGPNYTRASQLFAFSPLCIFKCEQGPNCTPQSPPSQLFAPQLFILCQQDCNAVDTSTIQVYGTDCPVFRPKSESLQRVQ